MTTFHTDKLPTIYVGYDPKEDLSYRVLLNSIMNNSNKTFNVVPLSQPDLRRAGLYRRAGVVVNGKLLDCFDGKPFSTEFSFTRFLVPLLNQYSGMALFMDCDMFIRADLDALFSTYGGRTDYAVQVVKHDYRPTEVSKMDNQQQTIYHRKNWSSFVLWNCSHPSNKKLTCDDVNTRNGSWLHAFGWLDDSEIGDIDPRWNWLDGHSTEGNAYNVHFTTGGPAFSTWLPKRTIDAEYASEWKEVASDLLFLDALDHSL